MSAALLCVPAASDVRARPLPSALLAIVEIEVAVGLLERPQISAFSASSRNRDVEDRDLAKSGNASPARLAASSTTPQRSR